MTVKQEGPLPSPRPSNKGPAQSENVEKKEEEVESKEKQPVLNSDASTSEKDETKIKKNTES